jgi:hypothetical protein
MAEVDIIARKWISMVNLIGQSLLQPVNFEFHFSLITHHVGRNHEVKSRI